jgi:glutamyl-tRNA reductase
MCRYIIFVPNSKVWILIEDSLNFCHRQRLMQLSFKALSISHENASLARREQVHLSAEACAALSRSIREVLALEEVLILSTCNRTEVYFVGDQAHSEAIVALLLHEKGIFDLATWQHEFMRIDDHEAAVLHLFEVAMGLRSQLLGDIQISNQVKQAYARAAELKLAGPILHRLLHTIFHANKRVQQETAYRDGAASVSYAAAQLAIELGQQRQKPSALVIGLGEMGDDVARNLVGGGFERVVLMNRSADKAAALATELGFDWVPFEDLQSVVGQFPVVIAAIAADEPILKAHMFARHNGFAQHFLIDLSIPRSIEPALESVPGILVYTLDEIKAKTDETLLKRLEASKDVRAIIGHEIAGFGDWSRELSISPTIQKLKDALEQIRQEELARYLKQANAAEAELLDKATASMMNKILKLPVLQLKAACKRGEQETLIDLLNGLFDLEQTRERVEE